MSRSNVVSLSVVREVRKLEKANFSYREKVGKLEKFQLLEEMIAFQEERSQRGYYTLEMMIRGQILFAVLEDASETKELKSLTRSYRRHLKYELEACLRNQVNAK